MNYHDLRKDMELAENYLLNSKLEMAVKNNRLMCEVYCLTSCGAQTFYARIYKDTGFTILYAKPFLADYHGLKTVAVSFEEIRKADTHIGFRGDVFCGMIQIPENDATMKMLLRCLPQKDEIHNKPLVRLDGISTIIINRTENNPKVLFYRDNEMFVENEYTLEETAFLHELDTHIEELVGNLFETNRT